MKKTLLVLVFVLISSFALYGCSPAPEPAQENVIVEEPVVEEPVLEDGPIELTLEELAEYDGMNGNKAYVAVDGIIYDMTDSDYWKDGAHNGFQAGRDLTKEIKEVSPHGIANLERVEEIGKLKE